MQACRDQAQPQVLSPGKLAKVPCSLKSSACVVSAGEPLLRLVHHHRSSLQPMTMAYLSGQPCFDDQGSRRCNKQSGCLHRSANRNFASGRECRLTWLPLQQQNPVQAQVRSSLAPAWRAQPLWRSAGSGDLITKHQSPFQAIQTVH